MFRAVAYCTLFLQELEEDDIGNSSGLNTTAFPTLRIIGFLNPLPKNPSAEGFPPPPIPPYFKFGTLRDGPQESEGSGTP